MDTSWRPPALSSLPYKLDGLIGYDVETEDRGLQAKQGPGWAWPDGGKIVGISFDADNWRGYLPFGHEGGGNLDEDQVISVANRWLGNPHQAKVGANILYDLGWSKRTGIKVVGPCYDIQWAEALLNEHRALYTPYNFKAYAWGEGEKNLSFHLDSLAKSYLGEGKNESLLRQAAEERGFDPKADLWRLHSSQVGPYATSDAILTRKIFLMQVEKLKAKVTGMDGDKPRTLWDLFQMECSLLPLYLDMRWRGVRVDVAKAEELKARWTIETAELVAEIKRRTGTEVRLNASASLAECLKTEGIVCPKAPKTGKDSVTKPFLETLDHWLPKLILEAKALNKLSGTFVDGQILGNLHAGNRVHTEFHPLRENSDEGTEKGSGTISGRLSSSHPNLQQVPKRSKQGLLLRECFLPEEGEEWYSIDYSQQEPRLTVHYAAITTKNGLPLPGAAEAVEKYIQNPKLSYHQIVADQTGLSYDNAKILNLALTYGRGSKSTARVLKVDIEKAKEFINQYHSRMPFVKALANVLEEKVNQNGEIKTLLGRVCRFPMWTLRDWEKAQDVDPQPYEKAVALWGQGNIRRAWLHKLLNALIQGSAADQTKKAMVGIMESGLSESMLVQVHDELGFSFRDRKKAQQAAKIMEEATPLKVPVIAEIKNGPNWGMAK